MFVLGPCCWLSIDWMTTELPKWLLLEECPGVPLPPPPSGLLFTGSLFIQFLLPTPISICFSAMLSKPLPALCLPAFPLRKVSWNLSHYWFSSSVRYKFDGVSDLLHLGDKGTFKIQTVLQIHTLLWLPLCLPALCLWCPFVAEILSLNLRCPGELMITWGGIDWCIHLYLFYKFFFLRQHYR